MLHRGKLLEKKIREASIPIATFSRLYGYKSKTALYNAFKNPRPPAELFFFAIKKYNLDFSDIPEMREETVAKLGDAYLTVPFHEHMKKITELQEKYIKALEDKEVIAEEKQQLEYKLRKYESGK